MSDLDIEKGAALAAALKQLFEQYPADGRKGHIDAVRWRQRAIAYAIEGNAPLAFFYASGTGVPDDVLDALRGLLT